MREFIRERLNHFLQETKTTTYEYQVRDIGGSDVYYKRKKGEKTWSFTDDEDFNKNSNKDNTIKFKK
jgi:hypothetical protein